MKVLHNLSINILVAGALSICGLLVLVIMGLHLVTAYEADASFDNIIQVNVKNVAPASHAKDLVDTTRYRLDNMGYYMDVNPDKVDKARLRQIPNLIEQTEVSLKQFVAMPKDREGQQKAETLTETFGAAINLLKKQNVAVQNHNTEKANTYRGDLIQVSETLSKQFKDYMDYAGVRSQRIIHGHNEIANASYYGIIAAVVVTFIVMILIYFALRSLVVKPLARAGTNLQRIADADLSGAIHVPGRNEIGKLFSSMRHMQQSLTDIVRQTRESSNSIYVGASEISSGNTDLSSRTEEQAASLEETASSMEEITGKVKRNADNASQASGLARNASETASHGGEVMDQVTTTMHGITESSQKVAEIITMIDSIAFQTNLLALNASVEAARAGEQGRGFAVVAGEVRNLAERSASAARDIKQLIDDSTHQVQEGSTQVQQAGETMRDVVKAVQQVTSIMDEISAASQDQSTSVSQVSQAVNQMDEVTQQNAALVEEITAAATSLEGQAGQLEEAVAVFKLSDSGHSAQGDRREQADKKREAKRAQAPIVRHPVKRPVARSSARMNSVPTREPEVNGDSDSVWQTF